MTTKTEDRHPLADVIDRAVSASKGALADLDDDFPPVPGDDDEEIAAPEMADPVDPVPLAAAARLRAGFRSNPGAEEVACRPGALVVLVVDETWSADVRDAFFSTVLQTDLPRRRRRWEKRPRSEPLDIVVGADRSRLGKSEDVSSAADAVLRGSGAVFVCPDLRDVPAEVAAAADLVLDIPPLNASGLRAVATAVGVGASGPIERSLPPRLTPAALRLAMRPGQTAAEYVDRLRRVVRQDSTKPVPRWTLENLYGCDAAVAWGRSLARDLRAYHAGELPWADVDRGALLWGPPGCGKTTYAQALAASAGAQLFLGGYGIWESGDDGKADYRTILKCMRATFAKAKSNAPSIVFIDEIDSFIARGQAGHNQSWFTPLVNGLLAEIDSVGGREGVVVIGASNMHPSSLDAALTRAGRLDRALELGLPGPDALVKILHEHLGQTAADLDLAPVAKRLVCASGADCERLARGARRRARASGRGVAVEDLLAELHPAETLSADEQRLVAVHEAGHALLSTLETPGHLEGVSVVRAGGAAGAAWGRTGLPESPRVADLERELRRTLAGRCAEILVFGEASAGAGGSPTSDLALATELAVGLEASFGLGVCGPLYRGRPSADSVDQFLVVNRDLVGPVQRRLDEAERAATELLARHRRALEAVTAALLGQEVPLTGVEVEAIVAAHPPWECVR